MKRTTPFKIVAFRVLPKNPDEYSVVRTSDAQQTAQNATAFLEATYPVQSVSYIYAGDFPDGNTRFCSLLLGDRTAFPCVNHPDAVCKDTRAVQLDMVALFIAAKRIDPTVTRAVGIVSDDYLCFHGYLGSGGLSQPGCPDGPVKGVLLESGIWTGLAHEVGHTMCLIHDTNIGTGRWVTQQIDVNATCFMSPGDHNSFNRWIDLQDYDTLFANLRTNRADPQVLLLGGIVSKTGNVQFARTYSVEAGMADEPIPGDYAIDALNKNGSVINSMSFGLAFTFEDHDDPSGTTETNSAGFAFSVAYPMDTLKIRIRKRDQVLSEVNPAAKLLEDAIDSIPPNGFVDNPDQPRAALHNQASAIATMFSVGDFKGAAQALADGFANKINNWLFDDYTVSSPLQMKKSEVVALINELSARAAALLQ